MSNPDLDFTLEDAVKEVLGLLTGLDLSYVPELDRFNAITRQLNRAMRSVAAEHEWSYYVDTESVGTSAQGQTEVFINGTLRPRIIGDDAVRLVDTVEGNVVMWAYFLPRDAIHKYYSRSGLWVASVRDRLEFSRPLRDIEDGYDIQVPCMREPAMFVMPVQSEDPNDPLIEVPQATLDQLVDFPYPDLVVLRAAYFYAQTDPVMQPRVQTLEEQYKDLMYQLVERDTQNTDSPFLNEFFVPVRNGLDSPSFSGHYHPHSDERRL